MPFWLPFYDHGALQFSPKLFLAVVPAQKRRQNQRQSATARLGAVRNRFATFTRGGSTRGKQNRPEAPRRPRPKVAPDPRVPMAAPAAGFNENSPGRKAPNFWTRTGKTARDGARHEALDAAPT